MEKKPVESWSVYRDAASRVQTAARVIGTLRRQKLGPLVPLAVLLFIVAALMLASHVAGPLAPFVYPLF